MEFRIVHATLIIIKKKNKLAKTVGMELLDVKVTEYYRQISF